MSHTVSLEIIGLNQDRFIDPFEAFDSQITSTLLSAVYKNGDSIIAGLEGNILAGDMIQITPGTFLKSFITIHLPDFNTFDLSSETLDDNFYLIVVEYQYQKVKPAPIARLRFISAVQYNSSIHLIVKIAEVSSGDVVSLRNVFTDPMSIQTFRRIDTEFIIKNINDKLTQTNYPVDTINVITEDNDFRLVMPDRSNIGDYYFFDVNFTTPELNILPIVDFNPGDLFIHDSKGGIHVANITSGDHPRRMYIDNGQIEFETPTNLRESDVIFKSTYDTFAYSQAGTEYLVYDGNSPVLVDSIYRNMTNYVAEDNLILFDPILNQFLQVSVDNSGVLTFQTVFNFTMPIEAFILDVSSGNMHLIHQNRDRILKSHYTGGSFFFDTNYNAITATDISSFPDGSRIIIHNTNVNRFFELFYNPGTTNLDIQEIFGVTDPVILNDDPRNINGSVPGGNLTIETGVSFFPLPGTTESIAWGPDSGDYVQFESDGANIILNETSSLDTNTRILDNDSTVFTDLDNPITRFRFDWDFILDTPQYTQDFFVQSPNDLLYDGSSAEWIFRVKKDDFRLLEYRTNSFLFPNINIFGKGIPFLTSINISPVTSPLVFNDWKTDGALTFRGLGETHYRLILDENFQVDKEIVAGLKLNDINVNSDRDAIFYDPIQDKNWAIRTDIGGAVVLVEVPVAVDGDFVAQTHMEYKDDGFTVRIEILDGCFVVTNLSFWRDVTLSEDVITIEDPDLTIFSPEAFVGFIDPLTSQKVVIDIDLSSNLVPKVVTNFGANDIHPTTNEDLLVFQDATTGEYYKIELDSPTTFLLTKIFVIPNESIIIKGSVKSVNAHFDYQYFVSNGVLENTNLNVFNGTAISRQATFYNTPIDLLDQDVETVTFLHDSLYYTIKYNTLGDLEIETLGVGFGGNIGTTGDTVFRDQNTGLYYKLALDLSNNLTLDNVTEVNPLSIIIRDGIIFRNVGGTDYRLEAIDGDLVSDPINIPPPLLDTERPPVVVPMPPDGFDYDGSTVHWVPKVLFDQDNETIALLDGPAINKARLTYNETSGFLETAIHPASNFPLDCQSVDGVIMRDQVTDDFYRMDYNFTLNQIDLTLVVGATIGQIVFDKGIIFDLGVNRFLFEVRNNFLEVNPIGPAC